MAEQGSLQTSLVEIRGKIELMAALTQQAIRLAGQALLSRDETLARQVMDNDFKLDRLEKELEEAAIRTLASDDSPAEQARFLAEVVHVASLLERMAGQAANVAQRVISLSGLDEADPPVELAQMTTQAVEMTARSVAAWLSRDAQAGQRIMRQEDQMDELNHRLSQRMALLMEQDSNAVSRGVNYILAARSLEKVADGAVEIVQVNRA